MTQVFPAPELSGGTISGNLSITDNLTVTGNLTVDGTTVTINSATLTVDDKNIELASTSSPTDSLADSGGITLRGTTDKTILWTDATNSWDFNQAIRTGNLQLDANTLSSTNTNGDILLSPDGTGNVGIGTITPDELLHIAEAINGVFTGLLIENSQANEGRSTNETAEIRFGFGGNNDVARIRVTKKSDYSTVANEDSALRFWIDINGTDTQIVSVLNSGLLLGVPASKLDFNGDAGGGGQGIRYKDAGGTLRSTLAFPGSDIVVLSNQAANGIVEIRANTSTAGSGGEVIIATFEDDKVGFGVASPTSILSLKMGTGTGVSEASGKANVNTTAVGTDANTVEKDLITYSLPANSLSADGKLVKITAWGSVAANGNTKTIRLDFGATTIRQIGPSAMNGLDWRMDGLVIRTDATTQDAMATEFLDTSAQDTTNTTPTETLSGAVVIKITGENGTAAANDIVAEGMLVEYLN